MRRNESTVPGGAAVALKKLAVSRPEAVVLAAVAAMLVPVLMLVGGAFPLPSLLERGVEFLIPGLADGNSRGHAAALPSRSGTLAGATDKADVVLSATRAPAGRGGMSVARGKSLRVTGSRGARADSVRVRGIAARLPAPVTGTSSPRGSSPPPAVGPGDGGGRPGSGGSGPGEPGTPAVSVGVNATASVSVEAAHSQATATAVVSASTSGVSVTGTVADLSIAATATVPTNTGEVATAAVTPDTSGAAVPEVTVTLGSVKVSTAAGLTPA